MSTAPPEIGAAPPVRPGLSDEALRAALLRGFAPGRRRLVSYGITVLVAGLALGLWPVLSADPELARASLVGKAALALLAGGLAAAGLGMVGVGWGLPAARADQVVALIAGAPAGLAEVARVGLVGGKVGLVDADDDVPQQLLLRTDKGLRLRVPMAPADISAVLARLAQQAPSLSVRGGD